jgi:hypothetical protein
MFYSTGPEAWRYLVNGAPLGLAPAPTRKYKTILKKLATDEQTI